MPSATAREMESGCRAVWRAGVLVPLIAVMADRHRLKDSRAVSEFLFLHMDACGLSSGTTMPCMQSAPVCICAQAHSTSGREDMRPKGACSTSRTQSDIGSTFLLFMLLI